MVIDCKIIYGKRDNGYAFKYFWYGLRVAWCDGDIILLKHGALLFFNFKEIDLSELQTFNHHALSSKFCIVISNISLSVSYFFCVK